MTDQTVVPNDKRELAGSKVGNSTSHIPAPSPGETKIVRFLKTLWEHTDDVTKWIQVVALVFAASWTYLTFRETEAPSFETPAKISARLVGGWRSEPVPGSCWIEAMFEVTDQGVKTFDVASTRVRLWRITLTPTQGNGYLFVNVPKIEEQESLADFKPTSVLIGHYAPKTDVHAAFPWVFYGKSTNDLFLRPNRRPG